MIGRKNLKKLLSTNYIVLIALIIFSLVILFRNNLYFPIAENDGARDYLVAHHIVKYGEFTLLGPWAGTIQSLINSPVYFYILAIFLFIKDDPTFLVFVTLALHTASAVLIYLLGKKVSNKFVAFSAAAFFILFLSNTSKIYAHYIWQPWLMLPLVNLSFLLLFTAFLRKSTKVLFLAIAVLLFSASIHNSAYAVLPLFLVFSLLLLRRLKGKPIKYLVVLLLVVGLPLLFYLPVLLNAFLSSKNLLTASPQTSMTLLSYYLGFQSNILNLIKGLTYFGRFDQIVYTVVVFSVFILFALVLYFSRKDQMRRVFIASAGLFVLQQLVFTSFFTNITFVQLSPIWGLFILTLFISVGYLFEGLLKTIRSYKTRIAVSIATLLIVPTLIISKPIFLEKVLGVSGPKNKTLMDEYYRLGYFDSVKAIQKEVLDIKEKNGLDNLNFFQIRSYFGMSKWVEAIFWINLEKDFQQKFIENSNTSLSYRQTNKDEYIFLICFGDLNEESKIVKDCKRALNDENPNYLIVKKIFSRKPMSIVEPAIVYLAEKR